MELDVSPENDGYIIFPLCSSLRYVEELEAYQTRTLMYCLLWKGCPKALLLTHC